MGVFCIPVLTILRVHTPIGMKKASTLNRICLSSYLSSMCTTMALLQNPSPSQHVQIKWSTQPCPFAVHNESLIFLEVFPIQHYLVFFPPLSICFLQLLSLEWNPMNRSILHNSKLLSCLEQAHQVIFSWIMTVTVATIMYHKEHVMLQGNLHMIHIWPKAADWEWCVTWPFGKWIEIVDVTALCICAQAQTQPHHIQLWTATNKVHGTDKNTMVGLIHIHYLQFHTLTLYMRKGKQCSSI